MTSWEFFEFWDYIKDKCFRNAARFVQNAIDGELQDFERIPDEPEIMPDGTLHITVITDVADIDRILLSQAGTHSGDLYYKDNEKPEIIRCKDCKYNVSRNHKCLQPDSFFSVTEDDFYCGYAERRYDEQPN